MKCTGSPTSRPNGRVTSRGRPRLRVRITRRVQPPGAGRRWKPQMPSRCARGREPGPRIGRMAGGQPVARLQHQGAVRLHNRHCPYVCRALELPSHFQALPLRHDAVRARLPAVVQPVPAVPAPAAAPHLHQPGPDPLGWRRKRRGHRRPAVGIMDELVAGIGTGGLLGGRAPGQHPGRIQSAYSATAAHGTTRRSRRAPGRCPLIFSASHRSARRVRTDQGPPAPTSATRPLFYREHRICASERDDAGWRAQIIRICAHHGQCHHAEGITAADWAE